MTASQVISGASNSRTVSAQASCILSLRSSSPTITPVSSSTGFTGQSLASASCSTPGPAPPNETFPYRLRRASSAANSSLLERASPPAPLAKASSPTREPAQPTSFAIGHPTLLESKSAWLYCTTHCLLYYRGCGAPNLAVCARVGHS